MKKPYILALVIVFINTCFFAQSEITISVSGQIVNTQFSEIELIQILPSGEIQNKMKSPLNTDGSFSFKGKLSSPDYYYVKLNNQLVPLILRNNSEIKIYGDGNKLDKFCNIINSDESLQLLEFQRAENTWNRILDSANNELKKNPAKQQELSNEITPKYMDFQQFKQNYVQMNQNSASLYPMIKMFDPDKDFENYQLIVAQVINSFSESSMVKIEQEKYLKYKKKMIDDNPLAKGKVAPDFEELKTDGKTKMKLSDLKGKVVLIDFWASWCGPCRKENPNVVKTYEKYKDAGFTVMSVSLDSDKAKWLEAIQKDGLVWPNHVSDLGGWQSKVARQYGVGSIPQTILLDKEGKILATNLRGQALETELQKIFGFESTNESTNESTISKSTNSKIENKLNQNSDNTEDLHNVKSKEPSDSNKQSNLSNNGIINSLEEKRLALVIGNSNYLGGQILKNPVNDANLISRTLKNLGFEVIKQIDGDKQSMEKVIREFSKKLPKYNVALFYYAGHGIQVDGLNYLIPIDAKLNEKNDCKFEAISVNYIVEEFDKFPNNMNVVILDACRTNPFRSWSRGESEGFKAINPSSGTIISFATSEGSTASDGFGKNGLFTEQLVKQMNISQPIESVFKKTRVEVERLSNGLQSPQEWSKLKGDFFFKKE